MPRQRDEIQRDLTAAEQQLAQAQQRVDDLKTELGDPPTPKSSGTGAGLPVTTGKPPTE